MLDERKWGKMIESEVEERHQVVTLVRSVLGFWYRICRSCPWATKLVLTLRIPYVLLMSSSTIPSGFTIYEYRTIIVLYNTSHKI